MVQSNRGPTATTAPAEPSSTSHRGVQRMVSISLLPSGRALVWDPSDVLYLRSHHRIIGILTGSLPLLPQQNAYLGVPLQLMPEEVALLLERKAAILVDDAAAHPSSITGSEMIEEQWQQWEREKQTAIMQQRYHAFRESQRHRKRFEKALAQSRQPGTSSNSAGKSAVQKVKKSLADASFELQVHDDELSDPDEVAMEGFSYHHTTYNTSKGLPWYRDLIRSSEQNEEDTAKSQALAKILDEAAGSDRRHRLARRRIFSHLNTEKHFYISCGLRFGGDFVVYPGDPFRYHSHFTLTVPRDTEAQIPAAKLIADGRLGTAVKKVHVIGTTAAAANDQSVGEDKQAQPVYYSLTWAGFGT